MTGGSKVVKITAKTALNGKMLKSAITSAIFLLCFFITQYSAGIFTYTGITVVSYILLAVMSIMLIAPILLGLFRYIWRLLFNADDSPISIFYYFSDLGLYKKALKFIFSLILKAIPAALILYIPSVIIWLLSQSFIYDLIKIVMPIWTANLTPLLSIAVIFATVALSFYMLRYYIAPVLFVANEDMDIKEIITMSNIIARKSLLDFIFLIASFIGWIFISSLAMPLLFTLPYMLTAYAVHARFAIAEYNNLINQMKFKEGYSYAV